uniref:Ribbon-helix-helix protein CopG domain-containing protein n=1 Tax=candidate division CPR3 bacterium TaxID=2268181 RepID=A0A7V3J9T9_UNCC3
MKVFFHSSIFGKQFYKEHYKTIVKICEDSGHQVYADHMLKRNYTDTDRFTPKEHQRDFQKLTKQIKESDAVIVEGTYPSIGTGHYMTIALNYLKPVLVLYQKDPHGVLVGDPNRLLVLKKYSIEDRENLKKKIKEFLITARKKTLKNRFNLMLDDEMVEYLDKKSKENRVSKADVVRQLVVEKLSKNKF